MNELMFYLSAFNSFPVAAVTLALCILINLSSANFEVHEISLALPPDACSNSRKPFPIPGGKREFGRKGTMFNRSVKQKNFRSESGKVSGGGRVGTR